MDFDRNSAATVKPARLVQVKTQTGCSWFFSNGEVLAAAEPLRHFVGWQDANVRKYIAEKGWQARVVRNRKAEEMEVRSE